MNIDSSGVALAISLAAGLLLGVSIFMLLGRRQSVADRVSAYVTLRRDDPESSKSLIERALGDKQARNIVRSPFLTRLRIEMEVAEIRIGLEQLGVLVVALTFLVGWLLAAKTHSPFGALLALCVPVVAQVAIKTLASRQRRSFSEQLPDNLQVIASAMRSGQTFVGALKS